MFFHVLRTRGNLKINWHIFHCKLTRCCSLFINSLEVQLQTTVARILCKLYIINVVPYAACRNFPQECQKNQKRKKNAGKKLGVFAWLQDFGTSKPICHQVTLATRTSMEANATKNPQKDVTLDAHSAKKTVEFHTSIYP